MTLKLSTITGTPVVLPRARAWDSTTMTFGVPSNLGAGSGTVSVVTSESLDTLKVKLRMSKDATPGSGASVVTFTMPTGYTIDFSKLTTIRYIGWGSFTNANFGAETDVIALSTTTFALRKIGAAVNITGADFTAGAEFDLYLEIPIVEFGSGFLSYGAGLATSVKPGLTPYSTRFQTKMPGSNQSMPSSETNYAALTFNNLTIGRTYRVTGILKVSILTVNNPAIVIFRDGSGGSVLAGFSEGINSSLGNISTGVSFLYTATTTTLQASLSGAGSTTGSLVADGTRGGSYITLEETPADIVTTWT